MAFFIKKYFNYISWEEVSMSVSEKYLQGSGLSCYQVGSGDHLLDCRSDKLSVSLVLPDGTTAGTTVM